MDNPAPEAPISTLAHAFRVKFRKVNLLQAIPTPDEP
jgi:hypothetical protein